LVGHYLRFIVVLVALVLYLLVLFGQCVFVSRIENKHDELIVGSNGLEVKLTEVIDYYFVGSFDFDALDAGETFLHLADHVLYFGNGALSAFDHYGPVLQNVVLAAESFVQNV